MREQSKASKRRFSIGSFHSRYFWGHGIDVGGKPDPLSQYTHVFRGIKSVRIWDLDDGDGQYLASIPDNAYDFLHSSHCLEHMDDPYVALRNWVRVTKPSGYIIVTVPDEDMYEQGQWPSKFNMDHKHTFTIYKTQSWCPASINVLDLLKSVADIARVEKVELIRDFFNPRLANKQIDQTLTPTTECSIEFILQKFPPTRM
ncbi:MAG: class I SAM-dependent methyltransferase [Gammaproteobacteria bacterium]|nr:MAG: class I SAM-dependent methyltransferase [Gammaproteobacteria bacterium]